MRILICGGRHFANRKLFESVMEEYKTKAKLIIHGAATGADTMAGIWARKNNIGMKARPANWEAYGRAAGPIRNQEMIKLKPDLVIAFPGGKGTLDMVTRARRAKIPCIQIKH